MQTNKLHSISVGIAALFLTGCATAPGAPNDPLHQLKEAFASDDPCSNNARNIGMVGGALAGILLVNAVGNGKDKSRLIGATVGGLVGGLVGADMDRKRCELSKVAKKYALNITFADIQAEGFAQPTTVATKDPSPTAHAQATTKSKGAEIIGNSVTIQDKEGTSGHFESGSDRLTPKAREYFAAIAEQYTPDVMLAAQADKQRQEEARKQIQQRHLLLVGHTDDTGSSALNADLSERRAKAVAAFLLGKGVPEGAIYYQGAGETLPVADNRTEAGRAVNRRVEIVELANEAGFQKYLEARKPQYSFYRIQPAVSSSAAPATTSPGASTPVPASSLPTNTTQAKKSTPSPVPPAKVASVKLGNSKVVTAEKAAAPAAAPSRAAGVVAGLDFGGVPYSVPAAKINTGMLVPESNFSLISAAHADDSVLTADCSFDRPRNTGQVKSLRDGSAYKTSEHLPQLYGKTWASEVNGNLVVINRLAVLRNGTTPANLPELKVYARYKAGSGKKPDVMEEPQVNSYRVDKGVLYRMFPRNARGVQCMDVLFALDGSTTARAGKLLYTKANTRYVTDFNPQLQ